MDASSPEDMRLNSPKLQATEELRLSPKLKWHFICAEKSQSELPKGGHNAQETFRSQRRSAAGGKHRPSLYGRSKDPTGLQRRLEEGKPPSGVLNLRRCECDGEGWGRDADRRGHHALQAGRNRKASRQYRRRPGDSTENTGSARLGKRRSIAISNRAGHLRQSELLELCYRPEPGDSHHRRTRTSQTYR